MEKLVDLGFEGEGLNDYLCSLRKGGVGVRAGAGAGEGWVGE